MIAISAAVVVSGCTWGACAHASDLQAKAAVRLAAVGDGFLPSSRRPDSAIDALRLVQNMMPERNGGQASEDLIIVSIDAAKPESLDDEIAREHELKINRRLVMSAVGLRIVSYRIADPQRLVETIQRLRADPRVNSVQANVAYRPVDPAASDTRMTSVKPPAKRSAADDRASRLNPARPRSARKSAGIDRPTQATAMDGPTSVRISRITAADVLAGGL